MFFILCIAGVIFDLYFISTVYSHFRPLGKKKTANLPPKRRKVGFFQTHKTIIFKLQPAKILIPIFHPL
jgi:hypothetical protein